MSQKRSYVVPETEQIDVRIEQNFMGSPEVLQVILSTDDWNED